jgi:hypothetical protein
VQTLDGTFVAMFVILWLAVAQILKLAPLPQVLIGL